MLQRGGGQAPVRVVEGGNSRQQSVENALAALDPDTDLVAVHDAVRPFIDLETIDKVIDEAAETGAAIVGIVPVDTVKQVSRGTGKARIRATLPREKLVLAQTPQVFRYDLLVRAFEAARERRLHRHRRIQPGGAAGRGSERGAGQRPQHQDHQARRHGPGAPVSAEEETAPTGAKEL
jgi:2-C-methyl-D-erythritol 4-phosphate cytidylyltransferase